MTKCYFINAIALYLDEIDMDIFNLSYSTTPTFDLDKLVEKTNHQEVAEAALRNWCYPSVEQIKVYTWAILEDDRMECVENTTFNVKVKRDEHGSATDFTIYMVE
jgi:hypothetical protein